MKLQKFLERHIRQMRMCFKLTHFDVAISRAKTANAMEIVVDYEYLDADIIYDGQVRRAWKSKNYDQILKWLAHELTHIITGELKTDHRRTKRTFYDERCTEHVSRLLYRLYRKEYQNDQVQTV